MAVMMLLRPDAQTSQPTCCLLNQGEITCVMTEIEPDGRIQREGRRFGVERGVHRSNWDDGRMVEANQCIQSASLS
jgi:hypothetical protein